MLPKLVRYVPKIAKIVPKLPVRSVGRIIVRTACLQTNAPVYEHFLISFLIWFASLWPGTVAFLMRLGRVPMVVNNSVGPSTTVIKLDQVSPTDPDI